MFYFQIQSIRQAVFRITLETDPKQHPYCRPPHEHRPFHHVDKQLWIIGHWGKSKLSCSPAHMALFPHCSSVHQQGTCLQIPFKDILSQAQYVFDFIDLISSFELITQVTFCALESDPSVVSSATNYFVTHSTP